jgi:hypothetical protein
MSKDDFFDYQERNPQKDVPLTAIPAFTFIEPGTILRFTKENVTTFHEGMRKMILDGGYGLFEYVEADNLFTKLKEIISKDSQLHNAIVDEIKKHGKEYISGRGVKFELAETGVEYDYSQNADWMELNMQEALIAQKRKALEDRLKKIPPGKLLVDDNTGEVLVGATKKSKSSFKVTLPK